MKTTFITASVSRRAGGVAESIRRLAQSLETGDRLKIAVIGLDDEYTCQDADGWEPLHPRTFTIWGPRAFGYAPGMVRGTAEMETDLIHAHGLWMYPSVVSAQCTKRLNIPYVVTPHGMLDPWALRHSRLKKRVAGLIFENAHLRGARCIHALCEAEALAVRAYGLQNPICIIPNGVDLPDLPDPASADADIDLNRARSRKTLLYLGRIHPKKGLAALLEGWHMAARQDPTLARRWELVIAGWDQGNHQTALQTITSELGLANSVRLAGPQFGEKKDLAFRQADAFVLPSLSEGLPMAVLEAWAYRLPVLMTRECNLPEGFGAGAAIEILPRAESIMEGVLSLCSMADEERRGMGYRGRELVKERFSWARVADAVHEVYAWVLGQGGQPPCVIN